MSYQLRMHSEIRDWLAYLRSTEPELARVVGEAVLAMLDAGECLGPPLVVPLESEPWPPADPREALDVSYQRQLDALQAVRRGVADVATSRKRVELQVGQLEESAPKLASQRERALSDGSEDLVSATRAREAAVREQLSELRRQHVVLAREEEELTAASQRLQAKVDEFRVRKETLKARYTAAESSRQVRAAFAVLDEADAGDLEMTEHEDAPPGPGAAFPDDELLQEIRDVLPPSRGSSGPAAYGDIPPPPGMMELRPGAPGDAAVALLFAVEQQDTAILLAWLKDPGLSPDRREEAVRTAAARLAGAQSGRVTPGSPATFIRYDAESFLDEFFPGQGTEVEIGAGTLVARHRAYTLAAARQRMGLTQAQVAERMNVRQERVSAIERAEPGATEVRTLTAYVRALGGRLEIIADISGERITLR
jgi:hypothetical protein